MSFLNPGIVFSEPGIAGIVFTESGIVFSEPGIVFSEFGSYRNVSSRRLSACVVIGHNTDCLEQLLAPQPSNVTWRDFDLAHTAGFHCFLPAAVTFKRKCENFEAAEAICTFVIVEVTRMSSLQICLALFATANVKIASCVCMCVCARARACVNWTQ